MNCKHEWKHIRYDAAGFIKCTACSETLARTMKDFQEIKNPMEPCWLCGGEAKRRYPNVQGYSCSTIICHNHTNMFDEYEWNTTSKAVQKAKETQPQSNLSQSVRRLASV